MKKPLIYVSCANSDDPIYLNIIDFGISGEEVSSGMNDYVRYEVSPYQALNLANNLLQFYQWKAKEGKQNDTTTGNVYSEDGVDTTKRTPRPVTSQRNSSGRRNTRSQSKNSGTRVGS